MKRPYKGSTLDNKKNNDKSNSLAGLPNKEPPKPVQLPHVNKSMIEKAPIDSPEEPYKEENYIDEALGNLFHEHFIKNGYMKTLECFQKEQGQGSENRESEEFKRLLLENFDKGDKDNFFRIFNKYTPLHIRMKDERTTKLEFYLNIYFLIFKVHPSNISNPTKKKNTIDPQTRQSFQRYLKSKGEALATTSQFLPYYALAYIQPFENPEFKQLFSNEWIDELRQRVISFVDCLYPSQKPLLCQIYQDFAQKSMKDKNQNSSYRDFGLIAKKNEQIQYLHRRNEEMQIYLQTLTKKYWEFQNNFKKFGQNTKNTLVESQKKWFQLTQQIFFMATALLTIVDSKQDPYPEETERQLKKIKEKIERYQGFINTNIDDLINQDVDLSMFEKPSVSMENQIDQQLGQEHANAFISLDIPKIKQVFLSQNTDETIALLKALKHRIKVAEGIYLKRQIVVELALFDIFGAKEQDQPILNKLLFKDRAVCQEMVKLVSALANDYYGRTYLFQVMDPLMVQMMKENGDTVIRRCLIVTFQFMSIRRKGQLSMIHNGFIKWIVNILKSERQTLSEENLEYLTALLMNLSFIKQGLDECEDIRDELMMNLIQLLEHKNKDIQSYINGTLYRVLSRKSFREKAQEHGLSDIIDYQINNGASVDTTQLNHVKQMLSREEEQNFPDDTEMEDLEDGDDLDDIDNEPLIMNHLMNQQEENQETNQERLLVESYTLAGPEIIEHMKAVSKEVDESLKRKQASFIRNQMSSQDRPRSVMRPLLRNRSNMSSNRAASASNRMLPSELRQRVRPYIEGQQQQVPISPMSRQSSLGNSQIPRAVREYENHPEYKQHFLPRNQLVRTPPHSYM